MAGPNVLQETVVKLGTVVDDQGINQILKFLTNSRFMALSAAAAFTGLTSAVYTFIKGAAENMRTLDELSRKQGKAVETVRASENALKAMGKTLNEVNKSVDLQKTYNDLVKINKELALPDTKKTLENINNLRASFWQMKDVASYAIDLIGAKVLAGLDAPIKRITENFGKIANWLKNNLFSVTTRISSAIIAFSKGLIGIAETLTTIVGFVNNLNPGIRKLGTAILFVWAIIKSGPLGQLIAAVTLIGDMIHDFENFKWNQSKGISNELAAEIYNNPEYFKGGYITEAGKSYVKSKVPGISDADLNNVVNVGMSNIWSSLYNDKGELDIANAAKTAAQTLTTELNNFLTGDGQINIADIFKFDDSDGSVGLLEKISGWFKNVDNKKALEDLGASFVGALGRGVKLVGESAKAIGDLGIDIIKYLGSSMNGLLTSGNAGQLAEATNGFAESFISVLQNGISYALKFALGNKNEVGAYEGGLLMIATDLFDNIINFIGEAAEGISWSDIGESIGGFVDSIFAKIAEFFVENDTLTKLPGDVLGAVNKIAQGITSFVASGLGEIANGDGIKDLTDSLFNVFSSSLNDLYRRLTDTEAEDHIDFTETGINIGKTIGSAITITADFMDSLVTNVNAWISGGGLQKLQSIGVTIGTEILNGLMTGLGDVLGTYMFGDAYNEWKELNKGTALYDESGKYIPPSARAGMTPEEMTVAQASPKTRSAATRGSILSKYGFGNFAVNDNPYQDVSDNYINAKNKLMLYWWPERKLYDSLVTDFTKAYADEETTPDALASASARLRTFLDLWNGGTRGIDKFEGAVNSAGENAVMEITADTQEAESKVIQFQNWVDALKFKIDVDATVDSDAGDGEGKAWGGRIGREMRGVTVGEDGAEYIVPVSKPERAAQLLRQIFGEMGTSFTNKFMSDFGIGAEGMIGGSMKSIASALSSGATINMNYNVSAPCTINVSASGVSAEQVGEQAYNSAQRHLLRTLKGVFA